MAARVKVATSEVFDLDQCCYIQVGCLYCNCH